MKELFQTARKNIIMQNKKERNRVDMTKTGIIRCFDNSGRIAIPKEVRKNVFGKSDVAGTSMEIFYDKSGNIILKPYYEEKKYVTLDELKAGDVISFHSFDVGEFLFGIILDAKESDEDLNGNLCIWRPKMLWNLGGVDTIRIIKSVNDVEDYKRREFVNIITIAKKLNVKYCLDIDI